jgi:rubredoxin
MSNEPTICYEFALDEAATEGGWHQANNYNLWVGRQTSADPAYRMIERRGDGMVHLPMRARLMHTVTAGTPYRIAHLFGAWRVSDADLGYLRIAQAEVVYHTLLTAMCRDVREDRLLWTCPACGHELVRESYDARRGGLAGFWPFLLERARRFNASPEERLCRSCGQQHPFAYGFDPALDRAEEAAARLAW